MYFEMRGVLLIFLLVPETLLSPPTKWTFDQLLNGIMFPRPPDSEGIKRAQSFISNFFKTLDTQWKFEIDEFEQFTVLGMKKFTNLIARFRHQCPYFILLGKE
jgi:hypothetical protein